MPIRKNVPMGFADVILDDLGGVLDFIFCDIAVFKLNKLNVYVLWYSKILGMLYMCLKPIARACVLYGCVRWREE